MLSGVERFAVEFLRRIPLLWAGLTAPQWFASAGISIGALTLVVLRRRGSQPAANVAVVAS